MGGVRGRGQERRGRGARGRTAAGGRAVLRALGPPAPVGVSWGPGCRVGCGTRRGARLRRVLCVPARAATPLSPHRRLSPSAPLSTAKARPAWKPPSLRALPFPAKSGSALALPSSQAERNSAPEPQIPVHFAGQLFSAAALSTAEPCEAPAALLSLAVCCVCGHRLPTQGTSGTPRFSFWRRARHPVGWLACLDRELSFHCLPGDSCCSTAACPSRQIAGAAMGAPRPWAA